MTDLNITYYYGQIKPEYRGGLALFMSLDSGGNPIFTSNSLKDIKALNAETEVNRSYMRTYIGVNEKATPAIFERFSRGELESAFDLDCQVVREEVVQQRREEVREIETETIKTVARFNRL